MRSALLTGLLTTGLVATLSVVGCGDGESGGTGGAGGDNGAGGSTTTTTTTTTTTSTTTTTTTTSTGTGTNDDGNSSFETAADIDFTTPAEAELEAPGDFDYYKFEGKKGQALGIFVFAQGSQGAFDPDTIDTVVTLYDAKKNPIAENNDRVPRGNNDSELFTILPADGTYYVRVTECWDWANSPAANCADPQEKFNTSYVLSVSELPDGMPGNVRDEEKGNDAASAQPITYATAEGGGYYLTVVYGSFESKTDVDVYSVDFPQDIVDVGPGQRAVVNEYTLRHGVSGDGSTTPVGRIYLTTQADPATPIAELNGTNFGGGRAPQLWAPIDLKEKYLLFFEHPGKVAGANDFYFALHGVGTSNPLEQAEAMNDTLAGAEPLSIESDNGYYIEGDLINDAKDVDHFAFDVSGQPAGSKVLVVCSGWRSGSGLRGLTTEFLKKTDGSALPNSKFVETADKDLVSNYIDIPAGQNQLVLKISATSQDPNVSSSFYRCGLHFQ